MQFNSTKYYALLLCCLTTSYSLSAKEATVHEVQQQLSNINPGFVENKGQVTDQYSKVRMDIDYNLKRKGVSLFLSPNFLHYQFNNETSKDGVTTDDAYRMDVTLIGANMHAKAVATKEQGYTEQYRVAGKMVAAKSFDKVTYQNVYPGIDWSLYIKDGAVEYDFIVHPGADASQIKLQYGGATAMNVNNSGSLNIKTPSGEITEHTPYTYALNNNKKISSSFSLNNDVLSFNVGAHDGTIVIDPQLQWSTYYGGTNAEQLLAVAFDASGNVYAGGYTTSTANIATAGAYQTTYNANNDGCLVKFNANGTIAWSTYFGGPGTDQINGVATDRYGFVYVTGSTASTTGIATASSFQAANGGGTQDAFLSKFSGAGALQWSTYYGGTGNDIGYAVVCDKWRSVYVTGATGSTAAIATTGAFNTTQSGTLNGFVARFDTGGNRIWGTYYGSGNFTSTYGLGISTDPAGSVYFTGETNASAGIASAGSYQSALGGFFAYNAFAAKFDSAGNRHWGTYYGSTNTYGFSIANDTLGSLYIAGYTTSNTAIASSNAYQSTYGGGQDGFLSKFDTAGNFKWGTYYGGSGSETEKGVTIDNFGNPIIAGFTTSTTGIATANNGVYQTALAGSQDAYVAKFTPFGQRMWGTYFGGALSETQAAIATSPTGGFAITGFTASTSGIATSGAYQTTNNGNNDGYVTRFNRDTFVVINQPYIDTFLCPAGSFNITYNTSYAFNSGNIFTAQLSDVTGSFAAPVTIGSVAAVGTAGVIPVTIPAGTAVGTGYRIRIVASNPAYTSPDEYVNIHIIASLAAPSLTSNSPVCVNDSIKLTATNNSAISPTALSISGPAGFAVSGTTGVVTNATSANAGVYTASVAHNGCPAATTSINVAVNSTIPAAPTATSNSPVCSGSALTINASSTASPVTYRITGPHGYVSSAQNTVINNIDTSMAGFYYIIDTLNGCRSAKDSILVAVSQSIATTIHVSVTPGDTICAGGNFSFNATTTNAGNNPHYQWRLVNSLFGDTAIVGAISNNYSSQFLFNGDVIYCVLNSNAQCLLNPSDTSNKITLTVLQPSSPSVSITVSPSNTVSQGTPQTFTATVVNGGSYTSYQWYVNGHPLANDTVGTLTLHTLADSDVVTVVVHNHIPCAAPDSAISNAIRVFISTGVSNVEAALNTLVLYPNPSHGAMTLAGHLDGLTSKTVHLEILNVIGQSMGTKTIDASNGAINEALNINKGMADGNYLLRITADGESRVIRFTVRQ